MNQKLLQQVISVGLTLSMVGCSAPIPTSTPPTPTLIPLTRTSIPPTPLPPTLTSILPTRTSIPPTATSILVSPTATSGKQKGGRPPIGTNLNGLSYWSTESPFLDLFKTSGAWVSGTKDNWNDGRQLDLDTRGWVKSLKPGQVALTVLVTDIPQFRGTLARRWVVKYEGTGTLEYGEQARLVEKKDHRDLIELEEGKGNATMTLTATDPRDYIRNISVTPEGNTSKSDEIFNPMFLNSLKGYRALRFMIWMLGESVEDIAARRWVERPTPQDARWTIKGAPVEIMVALANRVHADPWFSIPHGADDDYVRHFAETARDSLDPGLKVYLEYSNEVWNDVYPQTDYADG